MFLLLGQGGWGRMQQLSPRAAPPVITLPLLQHRGREQTTCSPPGRVEDGDKASRGCCEREFANYL